MDIYVSTRRRNSILMCQILLVFCLLSLSCESESRPVYGSLSVKLLREIGESDSKEIAIEELCPESCDCMVVVKPYSDLDEFDFDRRTRSLLRKTGIRNDEIVCVVVCVEGTEVREIYVEQRRHVDFRWLDKNIYRLDGTTLLEVYKDDDGALIVQDSNSNSPLPENSSKDSSE